MSQYRGRQSFTPATGDCAAHILASATTRAELCEVIISSSAAPVEQTGKYQIARTTSTGTTPAGSTTVVKRNTLSPGAGCTFGGGGYTTEPTLGDLMMDISLHQKSLFRWVAYPGSEICSALASSNGLGVMVLSQTSAFAIECSVAWNE